MKLSESQKLVLEIMRAYPNDIIVKASWGVTMTGGHGIFFERRTVGALESRGLISGGKLTELGKRVAEEYKF